MQPKQKYVIRGKIVTMRSSNEIIDDGYIAINNGTIECVVDQLEKLPIDFKQEIIIESKGTIFPGLIDLHNHFVYNVLPLWVVPKRYDNRSQWPAHPEYKTNVSKPIKEALAKYSKSSKALVRYVETKALISGTTTGQGMRTKVNGTSKIFDGAMRNVEEPGNVALLPAGTLVPDLVVTGSDAEKNIESFRRAINNDQLSAYFYHLSEGIDEKSRIHFSNLKNNDLINKRLVGIHSLGLRKEDFTHLASKGAKVVWSPFSNQLLYGKTIDLKTLKESNVLFSLGCDWTPSGSTNILQELKVAYHTNTVQGMVFSDYEIAQMVTSNAACVTGWGNLLGTIESGKLADFIIVDGVSENPYLQLIKAVEKDIKLVIIDGVPRYGDLKQVEKLVDVEDLEKINIGGIKKALYLYTSGSEINDVKFMDSIATLEEIMNDLPGFVKEMEQQKEQKMFLKDFSEEFTVELDNEMDFDHEHGIQKGIDYVAIADYPMPDKIDLDPHVVEGEKYWERILAQKNITDDLKKWLKDCYTM